MNSHGVPRFADNPEICLAVYVQLKVAVPNISLIVALGPNTVTGLPLASLIVVRSGCLTVRLSTFTPPIVIVQPPKVCAVSDRTALPGRAGLAVTLLVMVDLVHLAVMVVPGDEKEATVRALSPACRTAPTFTLGPPTLPVVRTSCVAAKADAVGPRTSIAEAAPVAARSRDLRIWMYPFLEAIPRVAPDPP